MDNSQNLEKKISCYFDGSFKSQKKGGSIGYIVIDQHAGEVLHKWEKSVFCQNSFNAELRAFHQLLVHIRRDKGRSDRYREADVSIRGDNKPLIDRGKCQIMIL